MQTMKFHPAHADPCLELPAGMHGSLAGNGTRFADHLQRLAGWQVRGGDHGRAHSPKELKIIPHPISAVSPNGKEAISINFARLRITRTDYGYGGAGQDRAER